MTTQHAERTVESQLEEFRPRLWRIVISWTGNEHDADDIVQDTVVRAIEKKASIRGGSFNSWVTAIARNAFLDKKRQEDRKKRKARDLSKEETVWDDQLYDDLNQFVKTILSQATEARRELLIACVETDWDYSEVAKRLDCSIATTYSKMADLRKWLRKLLGEDAEHVVRSSISGDYHGKVAITPKMRRRWLLEEEGGAIAAALLRTEPRLSLLSRLISFFARPFFRRSQSK